MRNTKLFKFIMMFVLVCSATAATASAAQAWTTNGPVAFTATAGGALLRVNSPTPAGVICQGPNTARGTLNASGGGATAWQAVNSLTFTWTNCTVAGFSATVSCTTTGTLWAVTWLGSGTTRGEVRNISCTITVPSAPCTITVVSSGVSSRGATIEFNNGPPATVTVKLTPAQTLTASWTGAGCAGIFGSATGSATSTITNTAGGELRYTVTSAPQPTLNP